MPTHSLGASRPTVNWPVLSTNEKFWGNKDSEGLGFLLFIAGKDLLQVSQDSKQNDEHRASHSDEEQRYQDRAE